MCFYNDDYDWIAEVEDATESHGGRECQCVDCGTRIDADEWRKTIEQRQYELCQICEDEFSDMFDEASSKTTCRHAYGETWHGEFCRGCVLLRQAVEAVERDEGCPSDARQPAYGDLYGSLIDHDEREKYASRAVAMFSELATHKIVIACLEDDD